MSVHLLYGRSAEVIWPCGTSGYISGPRALEARTRWSLRAPALALATGTNTSFLDRLYKTKQQVGTYIHWQWSAVRQAAWFMASYYPSGHHGGSRFWFTLLTYSSVAKGAIYKQANNFFGQLIDLAVCSNRMPWMRMLNSMFQKAGKGRSQPLSTLACGLAPLKGVVAQCEPHHRQDHSTCTCSCTYYPLLLWGPKWQNTTIMCSRGRAKRSEPL